MKVLILNGNPNPYNAKFDDYIDKLSAVINKQQMETVTFRLRDANFKSCIGCYSCWLKTPGECIFKDDGPQILKEYLESDLVILASPIIMGFISSILKRVEDRILPLVHPFLCIVEDRMLHIKRYEKYPAVSLLLDESKKLDAVSSELIENVFINSINRRIVFTKTMDESPEEVAYAINNI